MHPTKQPRLERCDLASTQDSDLNLIGIGVLCELLHCITNSLIFACKLVHFINGKDLEVLKYLSGVQHS